MAGMNTLQVFVFLIRFINYNNRLLLLLLSDEYVMRSSQTPQLHNIFYWKFRRSAGVCGCQGEAQFTHREQEWLQGFLCVERRNERILFTTFYPSAAYFHQRKTAIDMYRNVQNKTSQCLVGGDFPDEASQRGCHKAIWLHLLAWRANFSFIIKSPESRVQVP